MYKRFMQALAERTAAHEQKEREAHDQHIIYLQQQVDTVFAGIAPNVAALIGFPSREDALIDQKDSFSLVIYCDSDASPETANVSATVWTNDQKANWFRVKFTSGVWGIERESDLCYTYTYSQEAQLEIVWRAWVNYLEAIDRAESAAVTTWLNNMGKADLVEQEQLIKNFFAHPYIKAEKKLNAFAHRLLSTNGEQKLNLQVYGRFSQTYLEPCPMPRTQRPVRVLVEVEGCVKESDPNENEGLRYWAIPVTDDSARVIGWSESPIPLPEEPVEFGDFPPDDIPF